MSANEAYRSLLEHWAELSDLGSASALLSWDQETHMPEGGSVARGRQLATMAALVHQKLTDPRVGDWLQQCESQPAEDPVQAAALGEMRLEYDRSTRLPVDLVRELAEAESNGLQAWQAARKADDFPAFAPHLSRLVELSRRKAEALGAEGNRYDALLNLYERGSTEEQIAALFGRLHDQLAPLVAEALERQDPDAVRCLQGELDLEAQSRLGLELIQAMGFDLGRGRVDLSAHPFCSSMGHGDIRLTRRFDPKDLRPGLYGVLHEAGHGIYEQGLPDEWVRHPLGEAVSLGVHESQSRFWENVVARSRPFCEFLLPRLRQAFPGRFEQVQVDQLHRAVNQVEASMIRVEADELTYNLHVILRFEVERKLFAGQLEVSEIPELWNSTMHELLGVTPPSAAEGCLQDVHWAMGAFGYFPTYTLGNLYAAQLDEAMRRDLPDVDQSIRTGDFAPLRAWMHDKVHRHGRLLSPDELIEKATGQPPSEKALLRYLRGKLD